MCILFSLRLFLSATDDDWLNPSICAQLATTVVKGSQVDGADDELASPT